MTRNPLYLVLIYLVLNIVFVFWNEFVEGSSVSILSPFRFSLFIILTTTLFNSLTSHFGDTVLITVPGKIPLFSGPVTLEAMLFGFSNGLVLSALLTTFAIVNIVLPVSALIRLVPQAFYPLSIVVSIAITFLPSIRQQIGQIQEAQSIRGLRISGIRDWLPLFLPLLIGGLERSMQLAETMTARGFASSKKTITIKNRLFSLGGMLLFVSGWILNQWNNFQYYGFAMLICGIFLIGIGIWQGGKAVTRTKYKNVSWTGRDFICVSVCSSFILLLVALPTIGIKAVLFYQPYPKISIPNFDVLVGIALFPLLLPVFLKNDQ